MQQGSRSLSAKTSSTCVMKTASVMSAARACCLLLLALGAARAHNNCKDRNKVKGQCAEMVRCTPAWSPDSPYLPPHLPSPVHTRCGPPFGGLVRGREGEQLHVRPRSAGRTW